MRRIRIYLCLPPFPEHFSKVKKVSTLKAIRPKSDRNDEHSANPCKVLTAINKHRICKARARGHSENSTLVFILRPSSFVVKENYLVRMDRRSLSPSFSPLSCATTVTTLEPSCWRSRLHKEEKLPLGAAGSLNYSTGLSFFANSK